MNLTPEQAAVVAATEPSLIVLGGAGTGKTTTAAALVAQTLADGRSAGHGDRALFLSFSKSAVSQVLDRSQAVLGKFEGQVEITTFHALAWKFIARWGNAVGIDGPVLFSPSEKKLFGAAGGLEYDDLIPRAIEIVQIPAVQKLLARRWSVIVVDEFQDTSDEHWNFILAIRGNARLILLGDLNQCIYKNLPGSSGVGPARLEAAQRLSNSRTIILPKGSHRDPTFVLPAAAEAVRVRRFGDEAVKEALRQGMLQIRNEPDPSREARTVISLIGELQGEGLTVGVFSHHVDSTATLSDQLNAAGVAHDVVGVPESVDAALRAQFALTSYACGETDADEALRAIAIFVTSCERGRDAPRLARMIARLEARPVGLNTRLNDLTATLDGANSLGDAFDLARGAFETIGLNRGEVAWRTAGNLLERMIGPHALLAKTYPPRGVTHLKAEIEEQHLSLLTYSDSSVQASVQLMGLYQSKGREVDASVVVLRAGDYFGREQEPMVDNSKLLYVLLTRARKRTVVLTFGRPLPALVAPIARLTT